MSDILKQIQALQEQFSNLFEVEGLGEPSSEVPPSTNKLKKDIKTKNGKVELVSVENELFPYDGNKKEQFQQKVLDTINGMIQGTATLEDLLQIVRQKKVPLKEAMEVLEEMINEVSDELANKVRAKREENADKAFWDEDNKFQKYAQARKDLREAPGYNFGMVDLGKALDAQKAEKEWEDSKKSKQETRAKMDKNRQLMHKREIRRSNKALEEAMELMEDLFSTILKQPDEKQGSLVYKYHQAKNKENVGKDTYTQAKEEEKRKSKEEKGQEKTELRKKYRGKSTEDWKQGRLMDQIAKNAANLAKVSDPATAKAMRRNAQKADLKEALSLTEEIINEVSVGALARATENNLPKRKKNEEVAIKAYKQAQDEYEKGSKESPEDEPILYKKLQCTDKAACKEFDKARDAENLKDLNLPKDSKVSANKLFNAAKKVNPERQKKTEETVKNTKGTKEDVKKFLNSLKRDNRSFDISLADPVKSRADEALEEALTIISEVSKEFLKDKDDKAKIKVLKAIIKHGETMTPENPEGDPELLKIRQDSIDRLKEYREKCKDYLKKKEKRNDK